MYLFVRLVTYISRIQKSAAISNSIWWTKWRWSYVGFLLWNLPACGFWEIFTDPFLDKRITKVNSHHPGKNAQSLPTAWHTAPKTSMMFKPLSWGRATGVAICPCWLPATKRLSCHPVPRTRLHAGTATGKTRALRNEPERAQVKEWLKQ